MEPSGFAAVGAYVSDVVGCSPDRVTAVSRFQEGNRHAVDKVSYLGIGDVVEDVVVRVSLDGSPADRAQAEREASVLAKLEGFTAPRLYDFRCESPWFVTPVMCMEFLPGAEQELGSATPAQLTRLGSVVSALHARPIGDLARALGETGDIASYAEHRLEAILSGMTWVRAPLPAALGNRLRDAADALKTSWPRWRVSEGFRTDETLALLHGDISSGNLLWGPDPVLIDWEYTRLGDPADEIAYLLDQNHLTPLRREAFWRGYRDGASSQTGLAHVARRVEWWERLTMLGSTLWWLERWVRRAEADATGAVDPAVPRQPHYYLDHVTSRLDRLEDLLARTPSSPRRRASA